MKNNMSQKSKTKRVVTKKDKTNEMKVVNPVKTTCEEVEMQKAPLMFTIGEVAEKSGLPAYTIRTWIKTGSLPVVRIGRKYLISWDNFIKFLNSNMGVA